MDFKIDTKTNFTLVTPVTNHLDANLAAALGQKWTELRQSGSQNLVVDLHNCLDANKEAFPLLVHMQQDFYLAACSLVFTGIQDIVLKELKDNEVDTILNIAPTMDEATDIISMEILERDLLSEE